MIDSTEVLRQLETIARNLHWSWSRSAHAPFMTLNPEIWRQTRSPWSVLRSTSEEALNSAMSTRGFTHKVREAHGALEDYLNAADTWHIRNNSPLSNGKVAYFCAEFGLHESFPIYSGGLGILAGDHMKTASDMGLPMVGVGLLYRCGYVTQEVNGEGRQVDAFHPILSEDLPLETLYSESGDAQVIRVPMGEREVVAQVFRAHVGRIPLYLLDTDLPANSEDDRAITRHLYGGGVENRIRQEVLLGIGGYRALKAVGEDIAGYHMNEGHAAFLGLELALKKVREASIPLKDALTQISSQCAFTTHTPVDAGHDRFSPKQVLETLGSYAAQYGVSADALLASGRTDSEGENAPFNMTHLALRSSSERNGVSQLHGAISRGMFQEMWPEKNLDEIPIGGITNGTHIHSWLSKPMREALALIAGRDWREKLHERGPWEQTERLADATLWSCHMVAKKALLALVQTREERRWNRVGTPDKALPPLDPDVLTLGFARRFAPYKRATLIARDKERLIALLTNKERPVQLLFAGKCHPANEVGKGLLQELDTLSQDPVFEGKLRFVEGYDMELGRALVSGVDVWLNTPRRPREASGTSGMKAAMNGVPSLSILDGWWCEGYNEKNGWGFGMTEADADPEHRDHVDALALYETLENKVIPLFYEKRENGMTSGWLAMMKEAIKVGVVDFNTERMLREYVEIMYTKLR
jgi:starch phosphorylase